MKKELKPTCTVPRTLTTCPSYLAGWLDTSHTVASTCARTPAAQPNQQTAIARKYLFTPVPPQKTSTNRKTFTTLNQPMPLNSAAAEATRQRIAALWQRNVPQTMERLNLLDRAASAAAGDTLSASLSEEAAATAHKLAGSLGMFGLDEGTRLAREMEQHLESATPDAGKLTSLARQLRASLFPAS